MVLTEQSLADGRKYIPVPKMCQVKECNNPITAFVDGSHYRIFVCDDHVANNRQHTTPWNLGRTCSSANCDKPSAYIVQPPSAAGLPWAANDSKNTRCQACFDKLAVALTKPAEMVVDGVTYVRKP